MGRHSAPDDDDAGAGPGGGLTATTFDETDTAPRGRHHAPESDVDSAAEPAQAEAPATEQPRPERGSQADLRLLREHPGVRAQCLGAVLAPFVVYTVVFLVIDKLDDYALWLWAPIIAAGVLVGAVLDAGHKRLAARSAKRAGDDAGNGRDERPDED